MAHGVHGARGGVLNGARGGVVSARDTAASEELRLILSWSSLVVLFVLV